MGLRNGLSAVDLSDPTDVKEVIKIDNPIPLGGTSNVGNHAYVTNETGSGFVRR
ncbi:MAG: hypothetical protein R2788_01445 [Saprospiraceae bacterium]